MFGDDCSLTLHSQSSILLAHLHDLLCLCAAYAPIKVIASLSVIKLDDEIRRCDGVDLRPLILGALTFGIDI